ncbi:vitamin K epoxide reductase complex subunit 1-like [Tubulanus polymorphus]|uniref:vitamin K epoxide reductase complex subunit 1-like n=1 Tax=Tubulanus polymorphus TaxID=672921 RepID=UPI003DA360C7
MVVKVGELFMSNETDHMMLNCLGIFISVYSLYIELKAFKDKNYRAFCDFNEHMSCTRVLTSKYGQGFGVVEVLFGKESYLNVPNCCLGIVFYCLQLILGSIESEWAIYLLVITSIIACIGSVYLGTVLFVILKDFCLVCICTYILNGCLMYLNYQKYIAMDFIVSTPTQAPPPPVMNMHPEY